MRQYNRSATNRAVLLDQFGGLRRASNSLSTAAKRKQKITKSKASTVKKAPVMDIKSITNIQDFVALPNRLSYWRQLQKVLNLIVTDIDGDLRKKARRWAKETLSEMKAVSPVDTGNLRDSIVILSPSRGSLINETLDVIDRHGEISIRVGIDEQKILPPPEYKNTIKRHVKGHFRDPKTGRFVKNPRYRIHMPNFNYAPLADEIIKRYHTRRYKGYDFLNKWNEIAFNNMMRIF